MKILFLVYHGLSEHSGISKKILAQVEALRACANEVNLCTLVIDPDGRQRRVCDGRTVRDFGNGPLAKIVRRVCYRDILDLVRNESYDMVYIRHDFNSSPFTVALARCLKKAGAVIVTEIPTWPYDGEFKGQGLQMNARLAVDKLFRKAFLGTCDHIVLYSDDKQLYGTPVINISNGVDFSKIPLSSGKAASDGALKMLSVANIHLWHGLDRLIRGMGEHKDVPAELHIVGDGLESIIDGYRSLAYECGVADRVKILGPMFGEALDAEFEWANLAVGSLGRHRSGISGIKTLKNREYAARGVPFFYSENDSDFDSADYIYKVPADETPVDVEALQRFRKGVKETPSEIRSSVSGLSWNAQMKKVSDISSEAAKRRP